MFVCQLCAVYAGSRCLVCNDCAPMSVEDHISQHCPRGNTLVAALQRVCHGENKVTQESVYVSAYKSEARTDAVTGGGSTRVASLIIQVFIGVAYTMYSALRHAP